MQKIILRDYKGTPTHIEIDDNCEYIEGIILSGDMIMTWPFYCDSSKTRKIAYEDGIFHISRKNFETMNNITDSYEIQELD